MVQLDILENHQMVWYNHDKDYYGTRKERHRVGRFILKNTSRLPVTVLIEKLSSVNHFKFTPIVTNGLARNVAFYYRNYLILVCFKDVADWIKELIMSNNLYENKNCRRVDVV